MGLNLAELRAELAEEKAILAKIGHISAYDIAQRSAKYVEREKVQARIKEIEGRISSLTLGRKIQPVFVPNRGE